MSDQTLTLDDILEKRVRENQFVEFKQAVDFSSEAAKSAFLQEVVAFLNTNAGQIIIGVKEKAGACERTFPVNGNRDALSLQITQIILGNIKPEPLKVQVDFIDVPDKGFLINVIIPEHSERPYQNLTTGGFLVRTGARNTPLTYERICALFETKKAWALTLETLRDHEDAFVRDSLFDGSSATLHLTIVPEQHFHPGIETFHIDPTSLRGMREYHERGLSIFRPSKKGMELLRRRSSINAASPAVSRFMITDTWGIHSWARDVITLDETGKPRLADFESQLKEHLLDIQLFLAARGIDGPFMVHGAIQNLHSDDTMRRVFPYQATISMEKPVQQRLVNANRWVDDLMRKLRANLAQ